MKVYNDPNLIFIHVPKTAGTSVNDLLGGHVENGRLKLVWNSTRHSSLQHVKNGFGPVDNYHILVIKRNTWQRLLSFYLMQYKDDWRFPTIEELQNKRKFVPFSTYYNTITPKHVHVEDYFHYLEVDGKMPDNITYVDFDNMEESLNQFLTDNEIKFPRQLEHINYNSQATDELRNYLLSDPEFIEVIGEKYKREIEYFGFEPPI